MSERENREAGLSPRQIKTKKHDLLYLNRVNM